MKEIFVKKYWEDSGVIFYIYFQNGEAIAQIELSSDKKIFLSKETPCVGSSMLYDQSLDELSIKSSDYITKKEFMKVWNDNNAE